MFSISFVMAEKLNMKLKIKMIYTKIFSKVIWPKRKTPSCNYSS